jgi:FtsP/CotA-like multicopper oxidase with cupredoxin domain
MSYRFRFLIVLALFIFLFSSHNVLAAVKSYTFRLDTALWDYEGDIGEQWSLVYHQYIDVDGNVLTPGDPLGSWEPFLPGPTIRGDVGDIINVTIQNRIDDSEEHFIEHLMDTTIVHWHGIEMGNAYDGTPVTQAPIPSGTDFTYRMEFVRPGVYWYHPHWNSMIQNPLGANGAILCDDPIFDSLRTNKIIPHEDRTFVVTLTDIVFQDARVGLGNHVPVANVSGHDPNDIYIRDVMDTGTSGNFGDVILINGKHLIPFNSASGNTQQFWNEGLRLETDPVELKEGESVAFSVTNNGMHRFYKIHLAYKTAPGGPWVMSPDLFRIGGEGGLLDEARQATGTFDDWKLRGIVSRDSGPGLQEPQVTSELEEGEFLLPTASRNMVAFQVGQGWVEVALIANGFGVVSNASFSGASPTDQEIAVFNVTNGSANPDYVLASPIVAGTDLRINTVVGSLADALEDLSGLAAVTSFPSVAADMHASAILPPSGTIMQDYDITLTRSLDGGGNGPSINGFQAEWDNTGPLQDTYNNTRYVRLGDVVEWTIETQTFGADHPWHMHGFSFQPIKMELRTGDDASGAGIYQTLYEWDFVEYQDVVYVPAYHRVTYRFRVEDRNFIDSNANVYSGGAYGRWLAHCHIFKHAHRGMMMEFMVVDEDNGLTGRQFFTDVYLRDNVGDDGSIPSVGGISASPDIITRKSTVADGEASFGEGSGTENSSTLGSQVEAGQDNYIYVRAKNRGYEDTTDVTTDVYWSEVSTLVTPNFWNFIGTTDPIDVPTGDTLVVADPITWSQSNIPGEGHYCFVGITGNTYDPHTLTPAEVAGWATGAMTWEAYTDLIRNNNNVAWRNFNVVDVDPDVAVQSFGPFKFEFRGAFDRDREFDLLVVHPFGDKLLWKIPKGYEFTDELVRVILEKQMPIVSESTEFILVRVPPRGLIENLKLAQNKGYEAEFVVDTDNPFDVINRQFHVSQIFKFPDGYLGVRDSRPDPVEVGRVTWRFINSVGNCEIDVIDCHGVCGGGAVVDCYGVCGGFAVIDVCGECHLRADTNRDGVVNILDLEILSNQWKITDTDNQTGPFRCEECPRMGDLDCDGRIDKKDLLILIEDWLHSKDRF